MDTPKVNTLSRLEISREPGDRYDRVRKSISWKYSIWFTMPEKHGKLILERNLAARLIAVACIPRAIRDGGKILMV